MIQDKGVTNKSSDNGKYVDTLSSLEQTGRPFQGNPTFPGGYPTNSAAPEYPGYLTHPQSPVQIDDHFRHTNVLDAVQTPFYHLSKNQQNLILSSIATLSPKEQDILLKKYGIVGSITGKEFPNQYLSPDKASDDKQYMVSDKADHFIRDYNDPSSLKIKEFEKVFRRDNYDRYENNDPQSLNDMFDRSADTRSGTYTNQFGAERPVFSGSATLVNPTNHYEKASIIRNFEGNEKFHVGGQNTTGNNPTQAKDRLVPLSPYHPFTRIDPGDKTLTQRVKQMIFKTYNRTHTPVADAEFRKGFRHIFFSRPECYVMYSDNGELKLCEQALYSDDFSSLCQRLPHVVELLSPSYLGNSHVRGASDFVDNWNYLLSNRVISMSTGDESLTQKETVTKTAEGYTVVPGLHLESRTGSTISVSFRDTKDLEVYEFIKAWMLYIHNRARGIFAPPFNGYQKQNMFYSTTTAEGMKSKTKIPQEFLRFSHPYDRALEYCASIFDFVTNEADTKVIYWCKYYGIYPVQVSSPISNDNNGPLTNENMKIDVTFRYQYKLPCVNKTLVEFNYNSGICDALGNINVSGKPVFSSPFMIKDETSNINTDYRDQDYEEAIKNGKTVNGSRNMNKALKNYVGAAGLFTGTPMILFASHGPAPLGGTAGASVFPVLRFTDINDEALNRSLNLGHVLRVRPGNDLKIKYAQFENIQ